MYNRRRVSILIPIALIIISLFTGPAKAVAKSKDCASLIKGLKSRYEGNLNEAVASFERSIFENGDLAAAYLHLGLTWELKGDLAKARMYYERALNVRPNYACAHYYLNRLDTPSGSAKQGRQLSETTSPKEIIDNFSRYRGKRVLMKGLLMCWPCTKGPNPLMLISNSTVRSVALNRDANMESVFIVQLRKELPDDPRVRRGAFVEVEGKVVGRDFAWNPVLRVFSAKKKPVIKPEFVTIEDDKGYTGPLNLSL